jgi:dynactin 1
MENSYLKGQDLLKEIQELPPLPEPVKRHPTPPLDPSGLSDTDDSDCEPSHGPHTVRSIATERKVLYRDVIKFSSSPRVVDLSTLRHKTTDGQSSQKAWVPKKKTPAYQLWERKSEAERLSRRVHGLLERTNTIVNKLG